MHAVRRQRLILIVLLMVGISIAVALTLFALRENINYYFTPEQITQGAAPINKNIRGGGLVVPGSLWRDPKSLQARFAITDGKGTVTVLYDGLLPDLFREGQGIVAVGQLDAQKRLLAQTVLAKHDANYLPPVVQQAIDQAHTDSGLPVVSPIPLTQGLPP